MTNKNNIVSKLDFKTLSNGTVTVDNFKDENTLSLYTWNTVNKQSLEVSESNGVKILNVKTNNANINTNMNPSSTIPTLPNFRFSNFEVEVELLIPNIKSGNIYFGFWTTNGQMLLFNITNKFVGGLELFASGKHIRTNYEFKSNTKYNIVVNRRGNRYTFYINGLAIGISKDATAFNTSLSVTDNPVLTLGSATYNGSDADQFNGNIYGFNFSFANIKHDKSFTKYGDKLSSFYNFAQLKSDGASTTTSCELETVYNAPLTWDAVPLPFANNVLDNYWYKNTSTYSANLNNIFTMKFEMRNDRNVSIDLVDFGSYKIKYEYKKVGETQPEVVVNQYTVSAIDYENGGTDKIASTVWNYSSDTRVQSENTIFGTSALEVKKVTGSIWNTSIDTTKRLLDSSRPFTIDFYSVIKGYNGSYNYHPLFAQTENAGGGEQDIGVGGGMKLSYRRDRAHDYLPKTIKYLSQETIGYNDINKYTMTFDGAVARLFLNGKLQQLTGSLNGWSTTNGRFTLMGELVPNWPEYQMSTVGLMDNLNVFDGEVRLVREYDEFESNLVCDLQFDGYTGTRNFVDNAPSKPTWQLDGSGFQLVGDETDVYFNTGISYFQKTSRTNSGIKSNNVDMDFSNNVDFTLSFEIIKSVDESFCNFLSSGVTNYQDQTQYPKLTYVGLFGSSYTGIPPLSKKISFFNEQYLENNKSDFLNNPLRFPNVLVSRKEIEIGKRYKIDMVRKSGFMYLFINNELDNVVEFSRDINLSPTGLGMCIGYVPFSNEAGLIGGLNYVKAYKGVALFPQSDSNKLTLEFDNNLKDKNDYYNTNTWNNNKAVTFVGDTNSVSGYATKYGTEQYQYINSGKNDKLNYGDSNFDISFDVKNTNANGSSRLEVVIASGETSFTPNNTSIQLMGFHYQSNLLGNVTEQNNLSSQIIFGFNYNNNDYLQIVRALRNIYYKVNQSRIGNTLVQKINDVTCNITNYNINLPFNFNNADNTIIGKCLWRGQDMNGNAYSQFAGYVDNFKSVKDDLTFGITKYSNSSKSIIINKNNYLSIAPMEFSKYSVAQLDDTPAINRGIIEVEYLVHQNKGIIGGLCIENHQFTNGSNSNYFGLTHIIERGNDSIVSSIFSGSSTGGDYSMLDNTVISLAAGTICKTKVEMTEDDRVRFYINDVKIHDFGKIFSRKTPIAFRNYMNNYDSPNTEMLIKSVKMSKLNGEEIYYRDWKTSIENTIDRPTIDMPFIKSNINLGTSNVDIDSYFAFPTYEFYQGRYCVKFNNSDIRLSSTNQMDNPFDFNINNDFYIEMDFFIENNSTNKSNFHTLLTDGNGDDFNKLGGVLGIQSNSVSANSNKVYFRKLLNEDIIMLSSKSINFGVWNTLKFYRKDKIVYMDLNGDVVSSYINSIQFHVQNTYIGRSRFNPPNYLVGAISNFIVFSGRSDKPANYNNKEVLNIDFSPPRKSYLFKDKFNKHIIHPTNIVQREYIDSSYGVSLNGSSQLIQLGKSNLLNFGKNDFIINFKFKSNFSKDFNMLMCGVYSSNSLNGRSYIGVCGKTHPTENLRGKFIFDISSTSDIELVSKTTFNENFIYEITLTCNNGKISLYVNGVLDSEMLTNNENVNFNSFSNTIIGGHWGGTSSALYFPGVIYSVKVFRDTSDLSLINEEQISSFEEKFTLTNGNSGDDKEMIYTEKQEKHTIQIASDESKVSVILNDQQFEVSKNDSLIDNVKLFDNFRGDIKDLIVYEDVAFLDKDEFLGSEWDDIEYPEIEMTDDVEELQIYDIGDYILKGFIEGYLDKEYSIYNKDMNYTLISGVEDYELEIDESTIDDLEIHANDQRYPVNKTEMIKGFISGTVNLKACNVLPKNMDVYCYRSDTFRHIGTYPVDENGAYTIPNLDTNSRYDIVFRDSTRTIKDQLSNYIKPKRY